MSVTTLKGPADRYPRGTILTVDGSTSDIPEGWAICDGNNGTPNLLDKHVKSVSDTNTDPGTTVGTDSNTLSTSQLPSHAHTGSTDTTGSHKHSGNSATSDTDNVGNDKNSRADDGGADETTSGGGGHSHTITVSSVGGDSSFDNRPFHQEVIFMQKL